LTRLVIDASTLLSGLLSDSPSPPALILDALRDESFEAIVCPALISQVDRGLRKPYFQARLGELRSRQALNRIEDAAVMLADPVTIEPILRDPTDDFLVALARTARAQAIVTGDHDLLDHPDLRPRAIDARSACELLGLIETS
jgi:putative PIN family toxin of toxin-antitoxin system